MNEQLLPIEVGDLFGIEGYPDNVFLLIAPPCDLMVRKSGSRFDKVGRLLKVSPHDGSPVGDLGYILESYKDHGDWRVDLHQVNYVRLEVLDLCALRADGKAQFALDEKVPSNISLAWKARAKELKREAKKSIQTYSLLVSKGFSEIEANEICNSGMLEELIAGTMSNNGVAYNVRRIGRLRQPRAGAVLAKYANSVSRDAFDHDVTKDGSVQLHSDVLKG